MSNKILYRGINKKQLINIKKTIVPNGTENIHLIHSGSENEKIIDKHEKSKPLIRYDGSATYGPSEQNTTLLHQIDSSLFPTARISTTPVLERAIIYAIGKNKNYEEAYILQFKDLSRIEGFKLYDVNSSIKDPTFPEDREVEVSYKNNQGIPSEFIEKIFKVNLNNEREEIEFKIVEGELICEL